MKVARFRRIILGILVACGIGFGLKAGLKKDDYRLCGTDLHLARRYSIVDFRDAYGETEGKGFNALPGEDRRMPVTFEEVLRMPKYFSLVRAAGVSGELGVATNATGSCSIVVTIATGPEVDQSFPSRSEPWIVTIFDSSVDFTVN